MSDVEHSLTTALAHVHWLITQRRHTMANDRWLLIAESQEWARRVPGILDDPAQFRMELTPAGKHSVLPALIRHCCDERILADVIWLPLVTASGSIALHPVHGTCARTSATRRQPMPPIPCSTSSSSRSGGRP
jgi:hypothetical protein